MSDPIRPSAEGTVRGDTVLDANGFVRKHELDLGRATALSELLPDYAFFTPAVLYLHGRFRDAPLADYVHMVAPDARFYYKKFSRPMFAGLDAPSNGNRDWNFVLWAVARSHWATFSAWMVSLTFTYEDVQGVAGVGEQPLTVTDPLAGWPAELPVTAFGLNTSRGTVGFVINGHGTLPVLTALPPDRGMTEFAAVFYSGGNPVNARADARRTKEE